jgi:hypothetical protein
MTNPADYEEPGKGRAKKAFDEVKDGPKELEVITVPERIKKTQPQLVLKPDGGLAKAVDQAVQERQDAEEAAKRLAEHLAKETNIKLRLHQKFNLESNER